MKPRFEMAHAIVCEKLKKNKNLDYTFTHRFPVFFFWLKWSMIGCPSSPRWEMMDGAFLTSAHPLKAIALLFNNFNGAKKRGGSRVEESIGSGGQQSSFSLSLFLSHYYLNSAKGMNHLGERFSPLRWRSSSSSEKEKERRKKNAKLGHIPSTIEKRERNTSHYYIGAAGREKVKYKANKMRCLYRTIVGKEEEEKEEEEGKKSFLGKKNEVRNQSSAYLLSNPSSIQPTHRHKVS